MDKPYTSVHKFCLLSYALRSPKSSVNKISCLSSLWTSCTAFPLLIPASIFFIYLKQNASDSCQSFSPIQNHNVHFMFQMLFCSFMIDFLLSHHAVRCSSQVSKYHFVYCLYHYD